MPKNNRFSPRIAKVGLSEVLFPILHLFRQKKGALFKALPFIEFANRLICFIIKPCVMCAIFYIMV